MVEVVNRSEADSNRSIQSRQAAVLLIKLINVMPSYATFVVVSSTTRAIAIFTGHLGSIRQLGWAWVSSLPAALDTLIHLSSAMPAGDERARRIGYAGGGCCGPSVFNEVL